MCNAARITQFEEELGVVVWASQYCPRLQPPIAGSLAFPLTP
ncbi:hypothetical protein CGMCC3_g3979 [Colletotrichum fructicola]|nr:uncharacterized protein CGMCC3_g3979 [Colletotrichum fructicola]KAE9579972.1 hypothetical protein CGMCC3_g3979 [Colletotrichum fructicola]